MFAYTGLTPTQMNTLAKEVRDRPLLPIYILTNDPHFSTRYMPLRMGGFQSQGLPPAMSDALQKPSTKLPVRSRLRTYPPFPLLQIFHFPSSLACEPRLSVVFDPNG